MYLYTAFGTAYIYSLIVLLLTLLPLSHSIMSSSFYTPQSLFLPPSLPSFFSPFLHPTPFPTATH